MHENSLDILFSPFSLGKVEVRNRFVMPAMQRGLVADCSPTDGMIEYLRQRGEGGVGMIISEATSPDHPSGYWQDVFTYFSHDRLSQWEKLIASVKNTGAKFLLQLWHPGSKRVVKSDSSFAHFDTISPSGLIQKSRPNGRAATKQELEDVKEAYVRAAANAKRIGADGVELHGAHGYFLYQFLWHETNLREDEYGGKNLTERTRYPAEVVKAIRDEVGCDFIISFRFSQFAEVDYGAHIAETPDDLSGMLKVIRMAGADCFHASSRRFYRPEWPDIDKDLSIAGWATTMIDAPVISVGSVGLDTDIFQDLSDFQDPELRVEKDLIDVARRMNAGQFDLIGVGRAQIANPDFVRKVMDKEFGSLTLFRRKEHLAEFLKGYEPIGSRKQEIE